MSVGVRSSPRLRAGAAASNGAASPSSSPSSPHHSPLQPSFDSDSDSHLSPSHTDSDSPNSPDMGGKSKPLNRWTPNPNRRRFKLLRSFTMADFVTLGNAACGTCSIFFCLNFLEVRSMQKAGQKSKTECFSAMAQSRSLSPFAPSCGLLLQNEKYAPYLQGAFILLPLALFFDIFDGYVARYRQNSSPYGSDLDSLADVISFAVAPAVLGFTLGLRGAWDALFLTFFVCCGVSRLARYNVTAETLSGQ